MIMSTIEPDNINNTKLAATKAKYRLIGSIVLLICVLITLYYVSYQVESQPTAAALIIHSRVVESEIEAIQSSAPVNTSVATQAVTQTKAESAIKSMTTIKTNDTISNTNDAINIPSNTLNATKIKPIPLKTKTISPTNTNKPLTPQQNNSAQVVQSKNVPHEKILLKSTSLSDQHVQDLLSPTSGMNLTNTSAQAHNSYYVQFAALKNYDSIIELQQDLALQGIYSTIESINTANGKVYRLHSGPYSYEKAQLQRQKAIAAGGYTALVQPK
jgi:cell division septation protein DedD